MEQKYGDCRDKVCLLITLLKDAGFSARPVAVCHDATAVSPMMPESGFLNSMFLPWGSPYEVAVNRTIPDPGAFDNLICEVMLDGQPLYLDPMGDYFPYRYLSASIQGADALVLAPGASQLLTLPANPPDSNLSLVSADLKLDSSGALSGMVAERMSGSYDAQMREQWRDQTPIERKRSLDEQMGGIKTGARLDSFGFSDLTDLTQPATLSIHFTAPDYATQQVGRLFFRIPSAALATQGFGPTAAKERHTPLVTRPVRSYRCTCSIVKPQGYHFQTPPAPWKMENSLCRASIVWTDLPDRVVFNAEIVNLRSEVSVAEYPQLKAVADAFYRPDLWEVYFTK
jgi:hypothetical protein